jgi:hypothetical protein
MPALQKPSRSKEAHMVAHIIPALLGIIAPLSAVGWIISRGV